MRLRFDHSRRVLLAGVFGMTAVVTADAAFLKAKGKVVNAPAAFSFTPITGAPLSTLETSNTITLSGFVGSVALTVSGGQYSKNGGAYTSALGVGVSGDTITLQETSSASNSTETDVNFSAGTTSATWRVTTVAAGGSPPLMGPSATYNGTPGTGFDVSSPVPTDPTRTTAKPAMRMVQAWGQRFTDNLTIGVDAEAAHAAGVAGMSNVKAYVEGTTASVNETIFTDTDGNGNARKRIGYWFTLNRSAFTAFGARVGLDLYFEGTALDGTMQKRVIGPYRFYAASTTSSTIAGVSTDHTYTIDSAGGGNFTTLKAAVTQAVADAREAAEFKFINTSGTYDAEEVTATEYGYNGGKGFWVVDAAPGINVTIRRATYPTFTSGPAQGPQYAWAWGPDGVEFRGSGITLDWKNIGLLYSVGDNKPDTGGQHPPRFNGCTVTNSAGQNTYYFNKGPRPQGMCSGSEWFLEDATVIGIAAPACFAWLVRGCNFNGSFFGIFFGTAYGAQNYFTNLNPNFFFNAETQFTLAYSGAGSAGYTTSGGFDQGGYSLLLQVNGVTVKTYALGFDAQDPFFAPSALVTAINTDLGASGWTAVLVNDNRQMCQMIQQSAAVTSTPVNIQVAFDFHTDFLHTSGGFVNENILLRGNVCIKDGYTVSGAILLSTIRLADGASAKDIMVLENCFDQATGVPPNEPISHIFFRGNSYANEGQPLGSSAFWDSYCSPFLNNVGNLFWAAGTVSPPYPAFINNYINSPNAPNTPTAIASAPNSGNVAQDYPSYPAQRLASQALFTDPDNGDFRPAGALLTNLKPKATTYDANLVAFSATDAIGAVSVNSPFVTRPF